MSTKMETSNFKENAQNQKLEKKTKKKKSKTKKKVPRCNHPDCRTKLKLSDMPCKCKLIFCAIHRPFYKHNCCYIEHGMDKINGIGGGNFKKIEVI